MWSSCPNTPTGSCGPSTVSKRLPFCRCLSAAAFLPPPFCRRPSAAALLPRPSEAAPLPPPLCCRLSSAVPQPPFCRAPLPCPSAVPLCRRPFSAVPQPPPLCRGGIPCRPTTGRCAFPGALSAGDRTAGRDSGAGKTQRASRKDALCIKRRRCGGLTRNYFFPSKKSLTWSLAITPSLNM